MAPNKKKTVKNGFYYFMLEIQRQEQGKGVRCTLPEASVIASPLWKDMTPDEKKIYNDKAAANSGKKNGAEDLTKKFTSLGVSFASVDAAEREKGEFHSIMVATIKNTVANLKKETTLKTHTFFVCHVNYYYRTESSPAYFAPAEFALGVFNLEQGLIDSIHFFIEAGKIPLGLKYTASEWSGRTHNIPINDSSWTESCSDYYDMFEKVQQFILKHSSDIPPLYTMFDSPNTHYSHTAVRCFLDNMCDTANMDPTLFRVYNVAILFFELRNKCSPAPIPSVAIMKSEIEKDIFSYAKDLGCFFHEEKDLSLYCSLSMVMRWIFTICDHCCKHLNIQLRLGYHIPKEANINWRQDTIYDKPTGSPKQSASASSDKPLTIIDHGRLKEKRVEEKLEQAALYENSGSMRLPKTSYSNKIGATFCTENTSLQAPQELRDEASGGSDWTTVTGSGRYRGGLGHGRGLNMNSKKEIMPISGRGRLMNMNYHN